jgi:hypothetical protein
VTAKAIGYWTSTVVVALVIGPGGIAQVMRVPEVVETISRYGYPMHFILLLGVWKALGTVTLLVPGFPLLKEWAYAGIFFELTGAAAAVVSEGSDARYVAVPSLLAAVLVTSWALRPPSRRVIATGFVSMSENGQTGSPSTVK